jgi:cell wall-associated NlpC family hydrolase
VVFQGGELLSKTIKIREATRDIHALDKAGIAAERMKDAFVRTKDGASRTGQDERGYASPAEYAEDKITEKADNAVHGAAHQVKKQGDRAMRKIKDAQQRAGDAKRAADSTHDAADGVRRPSDPIKKQASDMPKEQMKKHAQENMRRARQSAERTIKTVHRTERTIKQSARSTGKTVKATAKGTVKMARKSIKTAQRTAKTSIKTTQQAAKLAQKSAQAAAKAAKAAAQAARVAARTAAAVAKAAVKATIAFVKMAIAAIKGLIAAIAAGGWVAVVVILVIVLVGLLLGSIFGIFFSNETDGQPMSEAVSEISTGFQAGIDAKLEQLKADGDYDEVQIIYEGDGDGDSAHINNWSDVLAVYAVLLNTDAEAGTEVVTITPEKLEKLKAYFEDMNRVAYSTEVQSETHTEVNDEGEEETVTTTTLIIRVRITSLSYEDAADFYHMSEEQRELLDELMQPEYAALFAAITGVDVWNGTNMTEIVSGLPVGTTGAEVVKAGLTKVGCPYVWGASGPNKFDCSGFAYWCLSQTSSPLGSSRTNAAGQAKWCYNNGYMVGRSELQPGDLVFWQNLGCSGCSRWNEIHHVGIYVGDGKVMEASSSKGRVLVRDLWESSSYPIWGFGRPYPQ